MYNSLFEGNKYFSTPFVPEGFGHTYQSYVVLLSKGLDRDAIIRELKKKNIETTLGTYSISSQPYFQKLYVNHKKETPNSDFAFKQTLTLPLYPGMKSRDIKKVSQTLITILSQMFPEMI